MRGLETWAEAERQLRLMLEEAGAGRAELACIRRSDVVLYERSLLITGDPTVAGEAEYATAAAHECGVTIAALGRDRERVYYTVTRSRGTDYTGLRISVLTRLLEVRHVDLPRWRDQYQRQSNVQREALDDMFGLVDD